MCANILDLVANILEITIVFAFYITKRYCALNLYIYIIHFANVRTHFAQKNILRPEIQCENK